MNRTCFLCRKPLPVEQRATVFCSVRCQERYERLERDGQPRLPRDGASPRPEPPAPR